MKALLKLINIHFWKSIIGPFFAFGFPLIFVAILGTLIGYDSMFASIISLSSIAIATGAMPQAIFEFKQSTLLKRIGITPIKPWMFLSTAACYYVVVMIIGTIITFAFSLLIFSGNMHAGRVITTSNDLPVVSFSLLDILKNTNWWGFIWSLLMCIMVSTSLGIMILSISKSTMMITGLAVPLLIIMQFLSGQVLPLSMLRPIDGLWYVGYITPLKPCVSLLIQASQGTFMFEQINGTIQIMPTGNINIFDIYNKFYIMETSAWDKPVYSVTENVLNLILPFLWTFVFAGISIKKFKWLIR